MGYQLLNAQYNPRIQCIPLRPDEYPELVYTRVEDMHFAIDPNSMAVLQIDSIQDFKELRDDPPLPYVMARYKPNFQLSGGPTRVRNLVMETCHDCNLACSYCFVRSFYADHGTGNYMEFSTAKAAIDRLLSPADGLNIGFFGGEPMLNMDLIKRVVEYAEALCASAKCSTCAGDGEGRDSRNQKNGKKCMACGGAGKPRAKFHVTTNGTLYSPENIKFLNDHGFSLITSIDGTSEAHDALRPMKRSGKGSHKQIMAGLNRLKQTPIAQRNTLRSTFTAIEGETIRTRVEFLNQLCDDGLGSWVSVEPAALSEQTCFQPNHDQLEVHIGNVWSRFYQEYLDTADWWVERAMAGKQPRFHNIHKSLERMLYCIHSGSECGAGRGYFSVNSKGELFGCHRESNSYLGHVVTGIDPKLQAPWLDNRIYTRRGCGSCSHRGACGGGCREDSLGDTGDIHEPSRVHCALKEMWIRSALKVMAKCPIEKLVQFCKPPSSGGASLEQLSFLPLEALERDSNGIIKQKWIHNVPQVALLKEGAKLPSVMPRFSDDYTIGFVDGACNPASPEVFADCAT